MSICKDCNITLTTENKNTRGNICNECMAYSKREFYRSRDKLPIRIYLDQVRNSKRRKHTPPTYSREEFVLWFESQPNVDMLFDNWVNSDYEKDLVPSADRLDSSKGYSFDNIELVSFLENKQRGYIDCKQGKYGNHRTIHKYTLKGDYVETYNSVRAASDALPKSDPRNIASAAACKILSAYKFQWRYDLVDSVPPIIDPNEGFGTIYSYNVLSGEVVDVFPGVTYVHHETNYEMSAVRNVCNGKAKVAHGLNWSTELLPPELAKVPIKYLEKSVQQYSLDGTLMNTYLSMNKAAASLGLIDSSIGRSIRNNKPYAGFIWKLIIHEKYNIPS